MLCTVTRAFADGFHFTYCAKADLENLLDHRVSFVIFTESDCFLYVVKKISQTRNILYTIGFQSVREAHAVHDISKGGSIRDKRNLADGMTKVG